MGPEKTKFHHFWKNPQIAPLEKILPTPMSSGMFSYATGLRHNFPEYFLLGCTKNAPRGFSNVTYTDNCQVTRANADHEAIHKAFRNNWLRLQEAMGRGKISFFDVLDQWFPNWK